MFRTITIAAFALCGAAPATAQSWGFGVGVEVGPPVYYGPPPGVYYGPPPVYYGPPPIYLEEPPLYGEPELPVVDIVAPGDVLDRLDAAGYRELSPMAQRGRLYRVSGIDPEGNLVALQISIFTGEVERADILEAAYAPPVVVRPRVAAPIAVPPPPPPPPRLRKVAPPPPAPPAAAPAPEPASPEPGAGGDDPLVIY